MFSSNLRSDLLKCFTDRFFPFITLPSRIENSSTLFPGLTALFFLFVCSYFSGGKDVPRGQSDAYVFFSTSESHLLHNYEVIITFRTSHGNDFTFE
jgi:hypothetical protein